MRDILFKDDFVKKISSIELAVQGMSIAFDLERHRGNGIHNTRAALFHLRYIADDVKRRKCDIKTLGDYQEVDKDVYDRAMDYLYKSFNVRAFSF